MPLTIRLRTLAALVAMGIVSCASPPAPEWLEGGHEGFPEDRWVVAVGAGTTATAPPSLLGVSDEGRCQEAGTGREHEDDELSS